MLQSSAERYKCQRQARIKWWGVKGSMKIKNEKGKQIKYSERIPDKGTPMCCNTRSKSEGKARCAVEGDHPVPPRARRSPCCPGMGTNPPLGVTREQ